MQISKAKLLKALEVVKPGLANKEKIEQTTSFAFVEGRVVTYNEEISISHPVEDLDITGAIQAEQLFQFLNKVKKDEIEITVGKTELIIQAGKSKAGIALQTEIKLPLDSISKVSKWKTLPEDFVKAASSVMRFAGKSMNQPLLTCVHVNEMGFAEASDGECLMKYAIEPLPVGTFLVPATSMGQIVRLQPTKVSLGKGWVHFKSDEDAVISCRVLAYDSYPSTEKILEGKGVQISLPKTTKEIVERAEIFVENESSKKGYITVTLAENKFKVSSKSSVGWFNEEVNIKYDDDEIEFSIEPYLLREILTETLDCTICTSQTTRKLKFTGSDWKYVTFIR